MALASADFVRNLEATGLLDADALHAALESLPAECRSSGDRIAHELVRRGTLTEYQAEWICAGRGPGLVLGNYVVLDKLGQGGMGLVLKAEHRRMERVVALKLLAPALTAAPEALRRFQREAKAAAKLNHPNIVAAHDADEADGKHFLVMEYVEGTDLSRLVRASGALSVQQTLTCVLQAARGLEYAHQRGIVHRDIKPGNLLVDGEGTVKILDMGLARLEAGGADQDQLTSTGQIMGTVDYMAPEQALDTRGADARSDVYALGATLWFLLTGRALFDGDNLAQRLVAHQQRPAPSLRGARGDVPQALEIAFQRMVSKDPAARQPSMGAVIDELLPLVPLPAESPAGPGQATAAPFRLAWDAPTSLLSVSDSHVDAAGILAGTRAVSLDDSAPPTDSFHVQPPGMASTPLTGTDVPRVGTPWPSPVSVSSPPLGAARRRWVVVSAALAAATIALVGRPWRPGDSAGTRDRRIPVMPLIDAAHLADGDWQDISIVGDVLTMDAGHGHQQLWLDLPDIVGTDLTMRARVRIVPDEPGGYAKIVFLTESEADVYLIVSDAGRPLAAWLEASDRNQELTTKVPWPSTADRFVDIVVVFANGRVRAEIGGDKVLEAVLPSNGPRRMALNVGGLRCEFEHPEVVVHGAATAW